MNPLTLLRRSLPFQVFVAVVVGVTLGLSFPAGDIMVFSEAGKMVIHWVKLVAGPFLFLTIVAAIAQVQLSASHGIRLVLIAMLNTCIAIVIGMTLAHLLLDRIEIPSMAAALSHVKIPEVTLSVSSWLKTLMPPSLFHPFVQNEILLIALLGLITGIAVRKAYKDEGHEKLHEIALRLEHLREIPSTMLHWLIKLIPFAVLAVVAGSVSEHGIAIFLSLFKYVGVVLLGFCIQICVVYGSWLFLIAKINPKEFWKHAKSPVLYAFGVNSSLATLPLTLEALGGLRVSTRASSLGAGVATNLNNDGIVLYEALAVFFIAQIHGTPMNDVQMITAALACIVASMGITGIPEAGFISLSVVVATLGLPPESLPLLLAVDWMIARGRSVVNVLSDMTLSIALDATEKKVKVL